MRNYNHRRSLNKIWAQEGRLFRQKVVIFPSFSSVIMNFFLINRTSFIYWSSSPKTSKSLMLEVAIVLKLTLFLVRSLKCLTPGPLSPKFSRWPQFSFQDFDNRCQGKHNTKIWGSSWCKRLKVRSSLSYWKTFCWAYNCAPQKVSHVQITITLKPYLVEKILTSLKT